MTRNGDVRSGIVSLITDFGLSDSYVGQIKASLLAVSRTLQVVDVTHQIPAQDVAEAAFQLATAWNAFPPGTVHLVVVDPGVGTPRRPIAFAFEGHLFVTPDNGLASFVLREQQPEQLVVLDRPAFHRPSVSKTFHGRDIFAPVAAHLASGRALAEVGTEVPPQSFVRLPLPAVERGERVVRGPVVSIDHFGNCRTLIRPEDIPWPRDQVWVRCGSAVVRRIEETYGSVPEEHTLALFGSHGGLEIAVRMGNAARAWDITPGMFVEVFPAE
ncbi:MAG: SAM-dependent chlorinase/fluorinase [Sphaerobacter sp.]|nr:SAM-dependent chlorinase/fluorinase [Sphaerobacter sp.]